MTTFGSPARHLKECSSTNDAARAWAEEAADPAPDGALVTAEFQTAGRGQRGRQWQAEAGQSALMSFVYYLPESSVPGQLGFWTALAVADALKAVSGLKSAVKWPNDILLDGRKAAGILVETAGRTAVLGIGINVNQAQFENAGGYVYPPTSLRLVCGRDFVISEVVDAVSEWLTHWEERLRRGGPAPILAACRECLAVGASVRQGTLSGTLVGLADSGAAQVRLADGTFAEWTAVN